MSFRHPQHPWSPPGPRHVHQFVGWPLIAAGSHLVVRSLKGDARHPDRPVTTGPYAMSRNPMYIGWGSVPRCRPGRRFRLDPRRLPRPAGLVHRQILREERDLAEEFGDEFEHYRTAHPAT